MAGNYLELSCLELLAQASQLFQWFPGHLSRTKTNLIMTSPMATLTPSQNPLQLNILILIFMCVGGPNCLKDFTKL